MATIVEHRKTKKRYALLGTGFGAFKAAKSHWFLGDLSAVVDSGAMAMVCVCDERGRIGWFDSNEVLVVQIDGRPPADCLRA